MTTTQKLRLTGFYPLIDRHSNGTPPHRLRAVATGEFRTPLRGEWYLSGAVVGAYRASNDLYGAFHIARIVEVEVETVHRIVREVPSS